MNDLFHMTLLAIEQEVMITNSRSPSNRGNSNRGSVRGSTIFSSRFNTFRRRGFLFFDRVKPNGKNPVVDGEITRCRFCESFITLVTVQCLKML